MLRLLICAAFFNLKKKYINWDFLCMLEAKGVDPFECLEKVFTLPWKPRFRQAVITPKEVKLTIDFTCPKCNFSDMYTFDLQREQFNIKRATLECGNCHEKYTR